MFRFWVAGAAFSSFVFSVFSCAGAELFDRGAPKGAAASTIVGTAVDSPIVTPTSNASTHFSGATGLGPFAASSIAWSASPSTPVPRSLVLTTGSLPVSASPTLTSDPLRWAAVTSYLSPNTSKGVIGAGFVSAPSTSTFAPTTRLYTVPPTTH